MDQAHSATQGDAPIAVGDVIRQMAVELEELSKISSEVESDIGTWLGLVVGDMDATTRGNAIRRLQRLDALTQTLTDLSKLAEALAPDADGEADPASLAASARLERVARLALVEKTKDRAQQHGLSGDLTLF